MIKLKACLLFLCILGMQLNATAQTIDLFAETPTTVAKDIAEIQLLTQETRSLRHTQPTQ
jgi:hypothetical protein